MDQSTRLSRSPPPARANGTERHGLPPRPPRDRGNDRNGDRDNRRHPGRFRSRSRSPTRIDRYQPYRDRDDNPRGPRDFNRPIRHDSPPLAPSNIDRYVPSRDDSRATTINSIRNPIKEDYQVGFTYFQEWFKREEDVKLNKKRRKHPDQRIEPSDETPQQFKAKVQAAYDEYKVAWNARMAKDFVLAHCDEDWFRERYVLDLRLQVRSQLARFRRELFELWEKDIENGVFDQFTLEGINKSESDGAGGVLAKEEGETSTPADLQLSDLLPTTGGDLRDPVLFTPTLLVKTLTPAISRAKLEELCEVNLGQGPGGFKWLSLSDPNPGKKFHRIGWVMLNSGVVTASGEDSQEANGHGMDVTTDGKDSTSSSDAQRKALELVNEKVIKDEERGDFKVHFGIHRPVESTRKKALWHLFSDPGRIEKDLDFATRLVSKLDHEMRLPGAATKVRERIDNLAAKGHFQPTARARAHKPLSDDHDQEMSDGEFDEGETFDEDINDDEDLLTKKKELDLLVEYLRRVHHTCLFCAFETDSPHDLQRKCQGGHLRRPREPLGQAAKMVTQASIDGDEFPRIKTTEDVDDADVQRNAELSKLLTSKGQLAKSFSWVKGYEDKILLMLEPENADLHKLGGLVDFDKAFEEELRNFVTVEDETKFRCKAPDCSKMFKSESFWRKHIEKRHEDWFKAFKGKLELINVYVRDPARIALGRNDSASHGHWQIMQQGGTPRGFNYSSHVRDNGGAYNGFNPQGGMLPRSAASFGREGGSGPIRNGGRYGQRSGPYDRNGGDRRGGTYSGRLKSPGASEVPGKSGARGFVEGGIGTFGPASNVEGRSVKRYDDLDASSGVQQTSLDLDY